ITAYKVYRSVGSSGPFNLIATVNETRYTDTTFPAPASDNFYRVTGVNAQGEGPYCESFNPGTGVAATPCVLPGIRVINDTNANVPVTIGNADNGSYDVATGVVTIGLSNSKAENIQAGQSLSNLNVRTFFAKPDGGPRAQAIASDITANATYVLVGNASCHVNQAPLAVLHASPLSGAPPLMVNFDGSGSSDPDPGDRVASYTFNFGDGSAPVTQRGPTISH